MQTRQNVEKMAKCGDFFSGARGNAKLMINFFLPNMVRTPDCIYHLELLWLNTLLHEGAQYGWSKNCLIGLIHDRVKLRLN